jgi:hypothetical protein
VKDLSLKFEDLKEGMRIEDWWGYPGTVIKCDNIHDIVVDMDGEGKVSYCLLGDCEDKFPFPIYNIMESI